MDGWMVGWMDGWMDGKVDKKQIDRYMNDGLLDRLDMYINLQM